MICRSPARLVDLSVILYVDKNHGHNCGDDMALFRLYVSIYNSNISLIVKIFEKKLMNVFVSVIPE